MSSRDDQDPGTVSPIVSFALLVGGLVIMLAAMDVIAVDPARLHAPRWIAFAAGLAFFWTGVLLALARGGATQRSPAYLFVVGLLLTTFTAVSIWNASNQRDVAVAIGPFVVRGAGADRFGTVVSTVAALIVGAMTIYCWHLWWRARRGGPMGRAGRVGG